MLCSRARAQTHTFLYMRVSMFAIRNANDVEKSLSKKRRPSKNKMNSIIEGQQSRRAADAQQSKQQNKKLCFLYVSGAFSISIEMDDAH